MDDGFFDIIELVSKYMTGELTGTERESLDNWLSLSEDNRKWFHEVTEKEFIYRKRQELRSIDVRGGWKALSRKRAKENRRRLGIRALKYACVCSSILKTSLAPHPQPLPDHPNNGSQTSTMMHKTPQITSEKLVRHLLASASTINWYLHFSSPYFATHG